MTSVLQPWLEQQGETLLRDDSVEHGRFVEVLRSYSEQDKRTRWQRGLIVGVGPGVVTEQARNYELSEHELLVKLSNGHAMAETVATIDRRHDKWRLCFSR